MVGEVLSQNEIDALLTALSSGEIVAEDIEKEKEQHKVKQYDFRRPNKFSKEQINTLKIIHDNYSRIISNFLSAKVRYNIQMKVAAIEQVTYEEFIHSIPNPTLLSIFKMPPFNGTLLLEINPQFGFQIIDLLCGGKVEISPKIRELTDIEKSIIIDILEGFINNMKLAWEDIIEVTPSFEALESNPQLNQTMSPNEPVALITFTIDVGETQSFVNLCIPYLSIDKIADMLYMQYWFQNDSLVQDVEYRRIIEEKISSSKVNLSVLLGKTNITIGDFMGLSKGDVLQLDKLVKDSLKMYVEDQMHFYVQPGIYKNKLSVQVVDIVEKDVELDE
jgi:flagellar motor switch protein FliM